MLKRLLLISGCTLALSLVAAGQTSYLRSIQDWRSDHETELKKDDGWLTLAGLFWLKEGVNTVGAGDGYDVVLTKSFKKGKLGEIELKGGVAILRVAGGVEAMSDGKPVTEIMMIPDGSQRPTVIEVGTQSFYTIQRSGLVGIRLRDKASSQRKAFRGLKWFPVNRLARITADFEAFAEPVEVDIPNVLGGVFKLRSPGMLRFELNGKTHMLQPVEEGEKLFIIFRDLTSRTETYGAGRFLYASRAENGKVILDFNKAENPPCAYTEFATCPLPPQQNRLSISIRAGEKRHKP